jgi:hypothetical protein
MLHLVSVDIIARLILAFAIVHAFAVMLTFSNNVANLAFLLSLLPLPPLSWELSSSARREQKPPMVKTP